MDIQQLSFHTYKVSFPICISRSETAKADVPRPFGGLHVSTKVTTQYSLCMSAITMIPVPMYSNMVNNCCVVGCYNRFGKKPEVHYFRFPLADDSEEAAALIHFTEWSKLNPLQSTCFMEMCHTYHIHVHMMMRCITYVRDTYMYVTHLCEFAWNYWISSIQFGLSFFYMALLIIKYVGNGCVHIRSARNMIKLASVVRHLLLIKGWQKIRRRRVIHEREWDYCMGFVCEGRES